MVPKIQFDRCIMTSPIPFSLGICFLHLSNVSVNLIKARPDILLFIGEFNLLPSVFHSG